MNDKLLSGIVEVNSKRIPVGYVFIEEDTIQCVSKIDKSVFITHYKSLVIEQELMNDESLVSLG